MKLLDRAMQVHGRVCMIETRDDSGKGLKHSLVLSVYREFNGTRYIVRAGVHRKAKEVINHLVEI